MRFAVNISLSNWIFLESLTRQRVPVTQSLLAQFHHPYNSQKTLYSRKQQMPRPCLSVSSGCVVLCDVLNCVSCRHRGMERSKDWSTEPRRFSVWSCHNLWFIQGKTCYVSESVSEILGGMTIFYRFFVSSFLDRIRERRNHRNTGIRFLSSG